MYSMPSSMGTSSSTVSAAVSPLFTLPSSTAPNAALGAPSKIGSAVLSAPFQTFMVSCERNSFMLSSVFSASSTFSLIGCSCVCSSGWGTAFR